MKTKILIVNQNSGYLTIDVANAFANHYDEVVLLTGLLKVNERNLNSRVKIHRTVTYKRTSTITRLLSWIFCSFHLFFLVATRYKGFKILYYSNPPISYFISMFFKNPFGIVIFDTYPNALTVLGIKKSAFIYRWWEKINEKVFPKAVKIITLSSGMKEQLSDYVNKDKINVVTMWPASDKFKPISKVENPFLIEQNWVNNFIVLYSGNMGMGHQIEVLIEVAERVKQNENILFLFIGEGAKKKMLMELVEQRQLQNVRFLTWQAPDVMKYSLASADLAVVSVEPEAANASVPSKTFNYMAVGAPLLCIGSYGSELDHLIRENINGRFFSSNEVVEITNYVETMFQDSDLKKYYSNNSFNSALKINHNLANEYLF